MACRQKTIEVISTRFFFWPGPGSGTLMKPKNHSMGVGGLLVQGLEPEKDLKAKKGRFLGQNEVLILFKSCVQVACWHPFSVCFKAFTIKGQTKAAAAFKCISAIY